MIYKLYIITILVKTIIWRVFYYCRQCIHHFQHQLVSLIIHQYAVYAFSQWNLLPEFHCRRGQRGTGLPAWDSHQNETEQSYRCAFWINWDLDSKNPLNKKIFLNNKCNSNTVQHTCISEAPFAQPDATPLDDKELLVIFHQRLQAATLWFQLFKLRTVEQGHNCLHFFDGFYNDSFCLYKYFE